MNNKVLVPTDFSANSRAGIRFAIQLASQTKISLIFYHCAEILKPTRWSTAKYEDYRNEELKASREMLVSFVSEVYSQLKVRPTRPQYIVQQSLDPKQAIVKFAIEVKAGGICMGTRGAGRLKKLIGTNASGVLTSSPVPVFVIPQTYRRARISHVFYSSDLNDLKWELRQVTKFANSVKARISVYNYDYLLEVDETKQKLSSIADRFETHQISFFFRKLNIEQPFAVHLLKDIRKSKPSVVVLFTNQKRGWFDRLFLSSKSAEVSFKSTVPLLVYPKR